MSTNVTLNGTSYTIPAIADASWGTNVANYLIAISTVVLQKSGGTFTLTAEIDFGATYGVKAAYFKSKTANIAAAGALRLAKTDTVSFRNNANGADLPLGIDVSDKLTFNSIVLATAGVGSIVNADISASAAIAYSKLALTGSIVNADVSGSAAIAYGKLALTGAILNADLAGSIAYSKLSLTGAILNADLAGSIAYSKLSLTGAILNADLAGSIAYSKLSLTGEILNADLAGSIAYSKLSLSGALVTGDLAASMLVPIGKGGTGETTANAALNALLPSQASANGKVLASNGTDTSWASALTSTLTSANIFVGNGSNVATAVAVTGDIAIDNAGLTSISSGVIVNADINASAAIDGSKLVAATNAVAGAVTTAAQSFAGLKTFYDGVKLDDAAGQTTLSYYSTVTNSGSTVSGGGAATADVTHTRVGNLVTITFSRLLVGGGVTTKSGNGALSFSIDAAYRPTNEIWFTGPGIVANVQTTTLWAITSGGVVNMWGTVAGGNHANGSVCGWNLAQSFSYVIV